MADATKTDTQQSHRSHDQEGVVSDAIRAFVRFLGGIVPTITAVLVLTGGTGVDLPTLTLVGGATSALVLIGAFVAGRVYDGARAELGDHNP